MGSVTCSHSPGIVVFRSYAPLVLLLAGLLGLSMGSLQCILSESLDSRGCACVCVCVQTVEGCLDHGQPCSDSLHSADDCSEEACFCVCLCIGLGVVTNMQCK